DWLQMQEAFAADSPILLLKNQNRTHGNECVIENLPHLQKQFPNLQEIVELDLGSVPQEKNWPRLLTLLQDRLLDLDHIGQPRPKTWVEVRQALHDSPHDQISRRSFLDLGRSNGIADEADALQLSDYLHHIGDILHFEQDPILKELVILKPTWALDAVYRILDNKQIIANQGRFTWDRLHELWHEAKYDNHRPHLLRLMQKFKLCYELRGSPDEFIAPQLLPKEAPTYDWDAQPDDLQLRYKYPLFMPRGILSRAIVDLHKRIEDQQLAWRFGVVLRDQYARAELLELRGEKEIRIRVGGQLKRDLLMEIVRTLEDLHQGFSAKLHYGKLIPCRCDTCAELDEPYFFKLDNLLGRLAHNKLTAECENPPYDDVQIPHLIGGIIPQAKPGDRWIYVNGNYTNVGDIKDGRGIAIGEGSSARVGREA
ncbi:MAG: hypothetical protein GY803_03215, partial [Chloroflexi bacterium]|nr:hypothetical protein [Chloroflexota bacterium]